MRKLSLLLLFSAVLFAAMPKFLMPDEAFKPSAVLNDRAQIEVSVDLAEDIYLYEEKLHVRDLDKDDALGFASVEFPHSQELHGDKVFLKSPKIVVNLEKIKQQTQSLESKYQQELQSLEELKKSILEKAFEGEL